jgi:hypothetical protein
MQQPDEELKEFLKKTFAGVQLSHLQQRKLQKLMTQELAGEEQNWWKRRAAKINEFLETTYEISLLPVAAGISIIVVMLSASFFGFPPTDTKQPSSQSIYYMQHAAISPDGSMRIVYVPKAKEGV